MRRNNLIATLEVRGLLIIVPVLSRRARESSTSSGRAQIGSTRHARAPLCAGIVQIVAPLASRKSRLEAYFPGVLSGQTTRANLLLVLATFCQCLTSGPLKGCQAGRSRRRSSASVFPHLASPSRFPLLLPFLFRAASLSTYQSLRDGSDRTASEGSRIRMSPSAKGSFNPLVDYRAGCNSSGWPADPFDRLFRAPFESRADA